MAKGALFFGLVAIIGSVDLPAYAQDPKDGPARFQPAVFVVQAPSVTVVRPVAPIVISQAVPPTAGGVAFSFDLGGGVSWSDDGDGDYDIEEDEQVLYAAGHLEIAGFLGWNLIRGASWSFDLGYRAHVSANGVEVLHRHQGALTLAIGSAFFQMGAGLSVADDLQTDGVLYGFSFDGVTGIRFGRSGFYLAFPMGLDAFRSLPPIKTVAITVGWVTL